MGSNINLFKETSTLKKVRLNFNIKLSIALILIFTLKTNFWVSEFLHNLGIPYLRFQKLFFLFLPGIYILMLAKKNKKIKVNNTFIFLLFYGLHYTMEHYAYGSNYVPDSPIDLLSKWLYMFLAYIFLINAGVKYRTFILSTVITLILINTFIIYLDYFGIINVAQISTGTNNFEGRLMSKFNLNSVNDMGVLAIYAIYWLSYLNTPYKLRGKKIPNIVYVFFISGLIFLQASRGSLLVLLVGVILFMIYKWKYLNASKKIIITLGIVLISLTQLNVLSSMLNNVTIIKRMSETSFTEQDALNNSDGRFLQIIASYENFKSSPFIGVGYNKAADSIFDGIIRSNFQYLQILASGGVLLFLVYFFMVFRYFGHSIVTIKKDRIVKSIFLFVIILFIFRRPEPYFAVLAFMVYERVQSRKIRRG